MAHYLTPVFLKTRKVGLFHMVTDYFSFPNLAECGTKNSFWKLKQQRKQTKLWTNKKFPLGFTSWYGKELKTRFIWSDWFWSVGDGGCLYLGCLLPVHI